MESQNLAARAGPKVGVTDRHLTPSTASADTFAVDRDVIVVGGGQACLAIGYFLVKQGCDFAILEAANQPAAAWGEHSPGKSSLDRRERASA